MAAFTTTEPGQVALIRISEDGRVQQIAMNKEQHSMLQLFVASMSSETPLVAMPEEYDLKLASDK